MQSAVWRSRSQCIHICIEIGFASSCQATQIDEDIFHTVLSDLCDGLSWDSQVDSIIFMPHATLDNKYNELPTFPPNNQLFQQIDIQYGMRITLTAHFLQHLFWRNDFGRRESVHIVSHRWCAFRKCQFSHFKRSLEFCNESFFPNGISRNNSKNWSNTISIYWNVRCCLFSVGAFCQLPSNDWSRLRSVNNPRSEIKMVNCWQNPSHSKLKCARVIRSRFIFAQHDYIIQFIVRVWNEPSFKQPRFIPLKLVGTRVPIHRLEMVTEVSRTLAHLCWSMKRENVPNILSICFVSQARKYVFESCLNHVWKNHASISSEWRRISAQSRNELFCHH